MTIKEIDKTISDMYSGVWYTIDEYYNGASSPGVTYEDLVEYFSDLLAVLIDLETHIEVLKDSKEKKRLKEKLKDAIKNLYEEGSNCDVNVKYLHEVKKNNKVEEKTNLKFKKNIKKHKEQINKNAKEYLINKDSKVLSKGLSSFFIKPLHESLSSFPISYLNEKLKTTNEGKEKLVVDFIIKELKPLYINKHFNWKEADVLVKKTKTKTSFPIEKETWDRITQKAGTKTITNENLTKELLAFLSKVLEKPFFAWDTSKQDEGSYSVTTGDQTLVDIKDVKKLNIISVSKKNNDVTVEVELDVVEKQKTKKKEISR